MGTILSVSAPSAQTTAPRDRACRLRCSSVNDVPTHFGLDSQPLAGKGTSTAPQRRGRRWKAGNDSLLHIGLQGETMTMNTGKPVPPRTATAWVRIPDGTKVKHRHEGHIGFIDGLTEIVSGPNRNPDGKTQYRMNIGAPDRQLVTESDLSILIDDEELVIMLRQKAPYRRAVTQSLHSVLAPDRFVKPT
ncbi:MAG: hypothetical protein ABI980_11045 [Nitrospirota bacterium]